MSKKYRLGIIGFAHMHVNHVASVFAAHEQSSFVACADTVPLTPERKVDTYTRGWNLQHCVETLGIPNVYEDYQEMLRQEELDLVVVCAENAQHVGVAQACAAAGVHVVVEKPIAASLSDALAMARAARAAGTALVTNWPTTWWPSARKAQALAAEGAVGRLLEITWRGGHTGPLGPGSGHEGVEDPAARLSGPVRGATWWHQSAAGGGAMLDYCCYGCCMSRWFLGEQAVAALGVKANLASHWGDAEDNALMVARYPSALGVYEGSWSTLDHGGRKGILVFGTTGTMIPEEQGDAPFVRIERGGDRTERIAADPLPEGRHTLAHEVYGHLEGRHELHPTLDIGFNLDVMAVLDAGVRSAHSGQLEAVENAVWCIG